MVAVGGHPRPTRWLPSSTRRPAGARVTSTNPLLVNSWVIATALSVAAFAVVTVDAVRGDGSTEPAGRQVAAAPTASTPATAGAESTGTATPGSGQAGAGSAASGASTASTSVGTGAPTTGAASPGTGSSAATTAAGAPVGTAAATTAASAGSVAPTANQVTAGPQGGDRPATGSVGPGSARCGDAAGDPTTDGLGDVDLLGVELQRDAAGLRVRFNLNGAVPPSTAPVGGAPSTSLWQVLLANGDTVLYAFSVTQQGTTWETNLVDFTSSSGDRIGTIAAPAGSTVEALIPADSLGLLPNTFSWWALTSTDRQAPTGSYIGDDCPNGTGDIEAGLALPAEATRSTFSS